MNKLRVAKKNEYTIEVNDNGDTISFNIEDPTLPLRIEKAHEEINKILDNCKGSILVIEKKKDTKKKNAMLSANEKAVLEIYNNTFTEMRKAMDQILGKGGCRKIFGDTNYLTMFDDLFESLEPHFEKMGISTASFIESIKNKYDDSDDEDVLEA